jgi:hypothetical protein
VVCKSIAKECMGLQMECKSIAMECTGLRTECKPIAKECMGLQTGARHHEKVFPWRHFALLSAARNVIALSIVILICKLYNILLFHYLVEVNN